MDLINLTPIHYLGLIYMSFAHQTDGVFSRSEQTSIWKILKKWFPENFENSEYLKIMDEITEWYKNIMLEDDLEETIFEMAQRMNECEWFTMQKRIEGLRDLRDIALADKRFLASEKKWIRHIAQLWNIDSEFVTKLVK